MTTSGPPAPCCSRQVGGLPVRVIFSVLVGVTAALLRGVQGLTPECMTPEGMTPEQPKPGEARDCSQNGPSAAIDSYVNALAKSPALGESVENNFLCRIFINC